MTLWKFFKLLKIQIFNWNEVLKQLKAKQRKKGGFSSMLLGTLGANLLGKLSTGKGILKAGSGNKK